MGVFFNPFILRSIITFINIFFILNLAWANKNIVVPNEIKLLKKEIAQLYSEQKYIEAIQKSNILIHKCNKQNLFSEKIFAYENLGVFYSDISDFNSSIRYYNKALLLNPKKDSINYYSIILNIGTTLMDASNYNEAKNYLEKAKSFFESSKPISYPHLIASLTNLSITYQNLHQLNNALILNSKAIQLAKNNNLLNQFPGLFINMGDIYVELGSLDEALSLYQDARFHFDIIEDKKSVFEAKLGIATVFMKKGKFAKAIPLFTNVVDYFIKIQYYKEVINCFHKLSICYTKLNNFNKALVNKELELAYFKKFKRKENIQTISNLQLQNEINENKNNLLSKGKLIEKEKRISMLLIIIIILLFITIYVVVKLFQKRHNFLVNKSEQIELNAAEQKVIFTEKLNHKDHELETFALHIVHKNEFLEEVQKEIKFLKKLPVDQLNHQLSSLLYKLTRISKKEVELKQFLNRVEEVNSNFYFLLNEKFPSLTSKEKKLCALIKLNLSSKDISLLTNVSIGAVTMARYRLRTKIFIEKDENLAEFLQNIR